MKDKQKYRASHASSAFQWTNLLYPCLAVVILTVGPLLSEDLNGQKHFSEALFEATFAIQADSCCSGTGFCVSLSDSGPVAFVTARHVLDSLPGDSATLILRKRLPDSTWQFFLFKQAIRKAGKPQYKVHPNPRIDVGAFLLVDPKDSAFTNDLHPFSRELLAKDDDIRKYWVHPGDEMFFLGYPAQMTSPGNGLFPILRAGFVSSYPITPLHQHPFIYLDASIFDGNSGGPVFFEYTASGWNGRLVNRNGLIVGLISFAVNPEVTLKIDQTTKKRDIRIAGFYNSEFILEVLDSLAISNSRVGPARHK
ncbi:MAG: serine protease [Candidatus Zixiibacteriota bacterium]